ncbi:hypothetical protein AMA2_8 [Achromobacter phage AMA2]|nr:hypothetical protein AMA2_8 [Achromobacter phage AMA2]
MSTGLKAWDINGALVLDLTDRITKVVASGFVTLSSASPAATIYVPGLVADESWMVIASGGTYVQYGSGYFVLRMSNSFGFVPGFDVSYTVLRR